MRETDPAGRITGRAYDANGNLEAEQAKGVTKSWTYDAQGRVTSESGGPVENTYFSNFAPNGQPQRTSHGVVQREWNFPAYPYDEIEALCAYDAFGNLLWEKPTDLIDGLGWELAWVSKDNTYSVSGRQLSTSDGAGTATKSAYDILGNEVEKWRTDAASSTRVGWVRKTVDPVGRITLEEYLDSNGTVDNSVIRAPTTPSDATSATSCRRRVRVTSRYDARGNLTAQWAPGSVAGNLTAATRYRYDAESRETSMVPPGNADSASKRTTYFAGGKEKRITELDGAWVEYAYDGSGNKVFEYRPTESGATSTATFVYNPAGQLVAETTASGMTTTHVYDEHGRETNTGSTTRTFNTMGWVMTEQEADTTSKNYVYHPSGRVGHIQQPNIWSVTGYDWDEAGRITETRNPDDTKKNTAYDPFGRVTMESETASTGIVVRQMQTSYDGLDRAVATTDVITGLVSRYQYRPGSSLAATTTIVYPKRDATVTVTYDPKGAETSRVTQYLGGSVARSVTATDLAGRETAWSVGGRTAGVTYSAAGKVATQSGYGRSTPTTYTFDATTGRKTKDQMPLTYPGTWTGTWTYGADGRLSRSVITSGSTTTTETFTFDAAGNLTVVTPASGSATTFTYHAATNQLLNRKLGTSVTTTYTYEASTGNRVAQGPTTDKTRERFVYDYAQHLTWYRSPSFEANYTYDASGQRLTSKVTTSTQTTDTAYSYVGLKLLSVNSTRTVSGSVNATGNVTFMLDANDNPYAGVYRGSQATSATMFYLVTTDRGDVSELLDAAGNAFAYYRYDPWGNQVASGTKSTALISTTLAARIAAVQPLRYAGYAYDSWSGLYYCSQRYYDPSTRQFITKDPAEADGEESAYQYCKGDPVGQVDPSGLWNDRSSSPVPSSG